MIKKVLLSGVLSLCLLQGSGFVSLANAAAVETTAETQNDAAAAADPAAGADDKEQKKSISTRFMKILFDSTYTYYMDTKNVRWIICPHTSDEQIVDVWIKMTPDSDAVDASGSYTYPAKYYLEHYYLRPSTQQIQFLCELEVTGRPDNDIQEKAYSASNWENLVPGSIEDSIYHAVLENIGHVPDVSKKDTTGTLSDVLDEYLRISI